MTLATDYLLAGVTGWLALLLYRSPQRSARWWSYAFMALAAGAFLGGTWHGFVQNDLLWKATVLSVGVASFAMVAGSTFATLSGRARDAVLWLAGLKLIAYWWWMLGRDDFIYVVLDTGIALLVVAALHLWRWNGPILAGVGLSVLAGLAQASGFALHPHFNHNDLYHVIQTLAVVLLYQGAKRLQSS